MDFEVGGSVFWTFCGFLQKFIWEAVCQHGLLICYSFASHFIWTGGLLPFHFATFVLYLALCIDAKRFSLDAEFLWQAALCGPDFVSWQPQCLVDLEAFGMDLATCIEGKHTVHFWSALYTQPSFAILLYWSGSTYALILGFRQL